MGYKEDISVNKYALDDAWNNNPDLVVKYSDLSVDANKIKEQKELKVEKIEDELKTILADLSLKCKFHYKDFGFAKPPSDDTAKSWAIQQPSYKDKQQELYKAKEESIEAREDAFKLRNAAQAFGERRYVIQGLQQLYQSGYYSESGRDVKPISDSLNESMTNRRKKHG